VRALLAATKFAADSEESSSRLLKAAALPPLTPRPLLPPQLRCGKGERELAFAHSKRFFNFQFSVFNLW
jgi:hypothetical protein